MSSLCSLLQQLHVSSSRPQLKLLVETGSCTKILIFALNVNIKNKTNKQVTHHCLFIHSTNSNSLLEQYSVVLLEYKCCTHSVVGRSGTESMLLLVPFQYKHMHAHYLVCTLQQYLLGPFHIEDKMIITEA